MTWLETLINTEIIDRIAADPRTTADNFLGYPKQHVFAEVLQGGRRIIEVPLSLETPAGEIVSLSVTDQALLYARYNQKGHLHELMHAFRQLIGTWRGEISILDIGCGPATGGLALASVVGPAQAFRYFGCDRSIAMLDLGGRLMAKARELDGIHRASEIRFVPCLNDVDFGNRRQVTTLVIVSYLLASPDLDIRGLAKTIDEALAQIGPGPAMVLCTNSCFRDRNHRYPEFREAMAKVGFGERCASEGGEIFIDGQRRKFFYSLLTREAKTEELEDF